MDRKIIVLLLVGITVTYVTGQQEAALASCVEGASANEIIATFRVDKNGADLTEVTAYSQDGMTAQTGVCTVGFIGNIAELVLTFDTAGALPCGIEQDGTTMTQYNIRVHAIGPSIDQTYQFYCNLPASSTVVTSGLLTVNGKLPVYGLYERTRKVTFMARYTDSDLPATTLPLGRSIYWSLTLCKGTVSYENTNWGRKFHVGFLDNQNTLSELSLDIYTPAIGTRVRVTGILTGEEFEEVISVSRDMPAVRFLIPPSYYPMTGTEDKGILIEGLDDVIGVRVNNDGGTGSQKTDSYVAFPDEALEAGTYRLPTTPAIYGGTGATAQFVMVGIEDVTTVTLTDDTGSGALVGTPLTITLNSQQTYTHNCGTFCEKISASSDKPIAVISGDGFETLDGQGHLMTPALPNTKFGSRFVLVNMDGLYSTYTEYKVLLETPDFTTQINWHTGTGSIPLHDDDNPIRLTGVSGTVSALELQSAGGEAASITQFLSGTATYGPTMLTIPPIEGWGTQGVIPVTYGNDYFIILVAHKGEVGNIFFSTQNYLGDTVSNQFSPVVDDVAQISGAANFEFTYIFTPVIQGVSWFKFTSASETKPFMLLAYEILADDQVQAYAPFGQRTPSINPAGGCIPVAAVADVYPGVRMGNGKDDDCDGAVDEELPNGIDDDSDTYIDEDTSTAPTMGGDFVALSNTGMSIAADDAFTLPTGVGPAEVILPTGCNVNAGNDVTKDVIASVGHFTASTADNTKYPEYNTIRTPDFMAFRFANTPALWARATVNLHDDTTGLAADSCPARKRRDVGGHTRQETVYLNLNIVDIPENNTVTEKMHTETCLVDVTFWSIATLLLVALASEIAVVTVLRKEKIQQF